MGSAGSSRWKDRGRHAAICRVLVAALVCCSQSAAQQPHVTLNGRFQPNSNGAAFPQRMTWASTTVSISFTGAAVTVEVAQVPNTGSSQLELRVDGHLVESATTDTTQPKNISIPYVGTGTHTLEITKITEALFGEALLTAVYLDQTGSFSPRQVALQGRQMEIIGASLMNGYGDMAQTMGCSDPAVAEDSLVAAGALAASHFGARWAQIAWSGAGILTPGGTRVGAKTGDATPPTIPQLYARTLPSDPSSQWNHASFVPQVVLVEAGGNDFRAASAPPTWQAAYKAFLSQIRSHAPDADIIVLGMPENVNAALGRPAAYIGNVTAALADLQGGGFQKLTYLPIPASVMQDGGGCDGHPTANTHALIAETVQSCISNITGWGPGNTQTSFLWRSDGGR